MIRVVINKEGDILLMVLANNKVERLCFKRCSKCRSSPRKGVLERYFNADSEKLDPVYKEIIRLIYREEIPK